MFWPNIGPAYRQSFNDSPSYLAEAGGAFILSDDCMVRNVMGRSMNWVVRLVDFYSSSAKLILDRGIVVLEHRGTLLDVV